MTQEDKNLLLKDLCARLPYGVKYKDKIEGSVHILTLGIIRHYERFIPFLRPMSSMTEEEEYEYNTAIDKGAEPEQIEDFYNLHHLDYRGLIPKGLALEAPQGMYKTNR